MSDNLNQAIALLKDLTELGRTTTSVVNQPRLDALVDALADIALTDAERFAAIQAAEIAAAADALVAAEASAAANIVLEEERAAQALVQEEEDQAEREERNRLGVS